ncbi:ficolin-2-like [Mytilus edulis]|uniref:ficolin-2-like n=1 Tax=Mytilus edulis TaxID=6550 RepID=UPI0039EEDB04
MECEDIPHSKDGVYTIYPGGGDRAVLVYCIMRQTKKWTVIQSRVNGSVDFYRTWNDYKHGFGSAYGEYWLGNDNIHLISTYGHHELSIDMQRPNGEHKWGNYSTFSLADEMNKYVLTVTGYTGNAGFDALDTSGDGNANGQAFSTKDRDNDKSSGSCAEGNKSAWWFNNCDYSDLNRPYNGPTSHMYWVHFGSAISKSLIMIRRT